MYCKECGSQLPDNATKCPNCGCPITEVPAAVKQESAKLKVCPESHLAKAIILTVLCCWPFGIPAIVNAAGVERDFFSGNYDLALEKSEKARKWCNVALIVGLSFWVLYFVVVVVLVLLGYIE